MKILILDDDDARHRRFQQWFAGYDVTHAFTMDQFRRALEGESPFDYIFLDHDLNDHHYRSTASVDGDRIEGFVGPCTWELTGLDAADDVCALPFEKFPGHVVVHSWNPDGARKMVDVLRSTGVPTTRWVFDPKEDLKLK